MRKLLMLIGALIMSNAYGATETVYWFNYDGTYSTNTCSTGGTITKPSNPTRTGFRFMGWEQDHVKEVAISAINTAPSSYSPTSAGGSGVFEWNATFSNGTVIYGNALCSNTVGTTRYETGTPTSSSGTYCWCQLKSAKVNNVTYTAKPNTLGVFYKQYDSYGVCSAGYCATGCAQYYKIYVDMRKALAGIK